MISNPMPASSLSKYLWAILSVSGLFQVGVQNVNAVAFRLPNQDPEAIARGNAFAATADNPSAIYYNPAGITQLKGQHFQFGLYNVSAGTEFTSTTGAKAKTDSMFQQVPQVYYTYTPKESRFSFGLGIYAPYGLSLDYGPNSPISTLAQNGKLLYACINPVAAWQVHPTLSIGIGPTINYSDVKFERAIGLSPGDRFKFQGDDIGYGFNAGVLWQPHEKWSFGLNYRYLTTLDYSGYSETFPYAAPRDTTAEVRFPQFVVAGVSFRPTENWNIEFNLDWTDWDNVNQIVFEGTSVGNVPFVLNYTSGFMYEFGVTRKLPNGFFVHAGYFFSENSSPDRFFNPIVPDGDLHLPGVGFGRKGERWNWAFGFHFGYNGSGRKITGNQSPAADGVYKTFNPAFNISVAYKF